MVYRPLHLLPPSVALALNPDLGRRDEPGEVPDPQAGQQPVKQEQAQEKASAATATPEASASSATTASAAASSSSAPAAAPVAPPVKAEKDRESSSSRERLYRRSGPTAEASVPAGGKERKLRGSADVRARSWRQEGHRLWRPAKPEQSETLPQIPLPRELRVAFDLHGTLDDGTNEGNIPQVTVDCVRRLLRFCKDSGITLQIWVCSYIGRSLGQAEWKQRRSAERRALAARRINWLAERLGYEDTTSAGPESRKLFLEIVNRKISKKGELDPLEGKASCLRHHRTEVLIDDRKDVADNCTEAGILVYEVVAGRVTLSDAVASLIGDIGSGKLWDKLLDTYSARTW